MKFDWKGFKNNEFAVKVKNKEERHNFLDAMWKHFGVNEIFRDYSDKFFNNDKGCYIEYCDIAKDLWKFEDENEGYLYSNIINWLDYINNIQQKVDEEYKEIVSEIRNGFPSDLRKLLTNGRIVERKGGEYSLVLGGALYCFDNEQVSYIYKEISINDYDENLNTEKDYNNIIKIYDINNKFNEEDLEDILLPENIDKYLMIVWERKQNKIVLTKQEIIEKLGLDKDVKLEIKE